MQYVSMPHINRSYLNHNSKMSKTDILHSEKDAQWKQLQLMSLWGKKGLKKRMFAKQRKQEEDCS